MYLSIHSVTIRKAIRKAIHKAIRKASQHAIRKAWRLSLFGVLSTPTMAAQHGDWDAPPPRLAKGFAKGFADGFANGNRTNE